MSLDYQQEVEELYKAAQKILMHELTEDEQAFIAQLAYDNHATLPEAKFRKLKDMVKKNGNLKRSTS